MDWGTLLGTALGALVGVGSTLIVDRLRWQRDQTARQRDIKRQLYGEYLAALMRTRNQLKDIASSSLAAQDRALQAGEAFREGGAYELRYQMSITASAVVAEHSDASLRRLRDVRNQIREGATGDDLKETYHVLITVIKALRDAMRSDLEASG
ncbi:hypothetical protein ACIRP2_02025 [Streptomyces sp. NPDC101194]|uniref:hypothetical protein n=1 Tax=Streptomyces sp. NPDC101194 TaxID=3366127 RepID=UPI00381E086F